MFLYVCRVCGYFTPACVDFTPAVHFLDYAGEGKEMSFLYYYELLNDIAKFGFDVVLAYLKTDKNLLWTVEVDDDEHTTEVEIETWDGEYYNSEFLTSYEFDENGKLI